MQKILSLLRRCVEDYQMIAPGERVGVGVSGGKDSLLLLAALARLARFYPGGFSVEAFTVDMGIPGMNLSPVADWCRREGIPFHRIPTQMYHVIFETRQEKNPCALCAKMRRGSLHTALREAGIEPKRLRFVQNRPDTAPSLFLIEGCRGGKPGLDIQSPLILQTDTGAPTWELNAIYFRDQEV